MDVTNVGVAAYLVVGIVLASAVLAGEIGSAPRARLAGLWLVFTACWPSVLVIAAVYQTDAGRAWVDRFVYGERRS